MVFSSVDFRGFSPVRLWAAALVGCAVLMVGCGEAKPDRLAVHPVKGKVLFKGQPAVGATVVLTPSKTLPGDIGAPRANVKADGTFEASTYETGDGAPEGEYKVTVVWYKPQVVNGERVQGTQNVIPAKYSSPETTPEVARVQAGANSLPDIVIK